jgi:hypothetical protein
MLPYSRGMPESELAEFVAPFAESRIPTPPASGAQVSQGEKIVPPVTMGAVYGPVRVEIAWSS